MLDTFEYHCRNRAQIQAIVDEDTFLTLIRLLSTAEFDSQKEAAWAVSNATSGGTDEQIMHLVTFGRVIFQSEDGSCVGYAPTLTSRNRTQDSRLPLVSRVLCFPIYKGMCHDLIKVNV